MQFKSETLSRATTANDSTPLGASPLFAVTEYDTLGQRLWAGYGARLNGSERHEGPFFALANRVQVDGVALHFCRYDTPVDITFSHRAGVRQMLCLTGRAEVISGQRRMALDPAFTGILEEDAAFEAAYREGYQQLVLEFDPDMLRLKAEALMETSKLDGMTLFKPLRLAERRRSREIALTLARLLGPSEAPLDLAIVELGQALTSAFLVENVPGFADGMARQPPAASRSVARRLEDYMQANWNKPISVEDIAAACGVSVRSAYARFRQDRGTTPAAYLRDVRLSHARRMLETGEKSVIEVVVLCGFSGVGHFARRYRERFGELPSTTAARARKLR